jgi:hypothetical protein
LSELPDPLALKGLGVTGIFCVDPQPAKNTVQASAQTDNFNEGRCFRGIKGSGLTVKIFQSLTSFWAREGLYFSLKPKYAFDGRASLNGAS